MFTIKNYVRAQSLEEAWTLNQKRSSRVLGGMLWLKMGRGTVQTAIDLSDLGLLFCGAGQDQAAFGGLFFFNQFDNNTVCKRFDFHRKVPPNKRFLFEDFV